MLHMFQQQQLPVGTPGKDLALEGSAEFFDRHLLPRPLVDGRAVDTGGSGYPRTAQRQPPTTNYHQAPLNPFRLAWKEKIRPLPTIRMHNVGRRHQPRGGQAGTGHLIRATGWSFLLGGPGQLSDPNGGLLGSASQVMPKSWASRSGAKAAPKGSPKGERQTEEAGAAQAGWSQGQTLHPFSSWDTLGASPG